MSNVPITTPSVMSPKGGRGFKLPPIGGAPSSPTSPKSPNSVKSPVGSPNNSDFDSNPIQAARSRTPLPVQSSLDDKSESSSNESTDSDKKVFSDPEDDPFSRRKFIKKEEFQRRKLNKMQKVYRVERDNEIIREKEAKGIKVETGVQEVIEVDFMQGEKLPIQMDVYNITIAANYTKDVSPIALNYSIKMCMTTFIVQVLLAYFFVYDYVREGTKYHYQPFLVFHTALRIIASLLLHQDSYKEF